MENILKLNLKKEVFENVKKGSISELTFETSPFYFSRFTTSKNNTVEDVEKDSSLFKSYDSITFSCSGESFDCTEPELSIKDNEFVLSFVNPLHIEIDEDLQEVENVESDELLNVLEETVSEVPTPVVEEESVVENTVEEKENVVETPKTDVEKFLEEYYKNNNVFPVSINRGAISYMGKIFGCEKRLNIRNEHDFNFSFTRFEINVDKFEETMNQLLNKGFVFICTKDLEIGTKTVKISYKILSRLTVVNLL